MKISSLAVPIMMLIIIAHGVFKNVSVYSAFLEGSFEGLKTAVGIIGPILAIFIAINMFRASGALTVVINLLKPVTNFLKIPEEMLPFAVLRPISGGGSLAMATDIFKKYGCDSFVGRCFRTYGINGNNLLRNKRVFRKHRNKKYTPYC